jgi:hypothetical protein
MTVTNAAATVARNTETDTKASALDLGLDSIVLLKGQGKSSIKNIVSPSSFRGWLESSPSEGERWLRSAAHEERPAILSLIEQRYPSRDPVTAIVAWVRQLSELGVLGARFREPWLLMLQCLLTKRSNQEIQEAFSDQYPTEQIPNIESGLGELSSGLQDSWLLEPVFQN